MPRVYFTGRRKIPGRDVSIHIVPGRPPSFRASIDLSRQTRSLAGDAHVVVQASHNTMIQQFDFGTVADCRPMTDLVLSNFDEWDRPNFRILVIGKDPPGVVLAACDHVSAVEQDEAAAGGRSMLPLRAQPAAKMNGELWKVVQQGNAFELWYNKDVSAFASRLKGKYPDTLGAILPAAIREILARTHLWKEVNTEPTDWTRFAQTVCSDPMPTEVEGEPPSAEDMEAWIDNVVGEFCRSRGRFLERISAFEEPHESTAIQ